MSKFDEIESEIRNTPGLAKKMLTWGAVGGAAGIVLPFAIPLWAIGGATAAYMTRRKTRG